MSSKTPELRIPCLGSGYRLKGGFLARPLLSRNLTVKTLCA